MLSYSESNGVFAGVSLSGTTMGPDEDANKNLYGKKITGPEIFKSEMPPPAADVLISTLKEKSPTNASGREVIKHFPQGAEWTAEVCVAFH